MHFTGDLHAVGAAHNLLAALVDNAIHFRSELDLEQRQIFWRRVLDVNDRALRQVVIGLGGRPNGVPREASFDITAASEVMAILCLAEGIEDLKARLGRILVGFDRSGNPVTAAGLRAVGAMAALLHDVIITMGVISMAQVEFDLTVVAAILAVASLEIWLCWTRLTALHRR